MAVDSCTGCRGPAALAAGAWLQQPPGPGCASRQDPARGAHACLGHLAYDTLPRTLCLGRIAWHTAQDTLPGTSCLGHLA